MECINSLDKFDSFELSQIDDALLMSFLDDTQVVEDCDDEKLSSVIRSLEAEIDQHTVDTFEDNNWTRNSWSDHEHAHFDGEYNSSLDHELDFNWMNMEMEMAPSSLSDGMASWYIEPCGDHICMDGVTEFGSEKDYYNFQLFNDIPFEDHECCSYSTMWQDTNVPLVR